MHLHGQRTAPQRQESSNMDTTNNDEVITLPDPAQPLLQKPEQDIPRTKQKLGTALVICSCILFSGMHTSVRYASEKLGFDPIFLAICRGTAQFILITTLIISFGVRRLTPELPRKTGLFLLLRGFFGSLAMLTKYESISRLPVGVAVSLFSTTPIFAAVFGWIFVGEALTVPDIISMAVCLSGAVLVGISDGPLKLDGHITGVVLGLCGASVTGLVFVVIRGLGTRVHFFFSVQALSIGAMFTPFLLRVIQVGNIAEAWEFVGQNIQKAFSSREAMVAVSCVGCFAFAAAMCLNRALQLLGAGNAATIRTFDIPINFLTGFLIMGELPHAVGQVVGCVLITIGIYVNVAAKGKK